MFWTISFWWASNNHSLFLACFTAQIVTAQRSFEKKSQLKFQKVPEKPHRILSQFFFTRIFHTKASFGNLYHTLCFETLELKILFQVFLVFRVQDFRRTLLLLSLVCMIIPRICFHVCFLFYEIKILNNKLKLDASWSLEFSVAVNHPGEIALSGICLG